MADLNEWPAVQTDHWSRVPALQHLSMASDNKNRWARVPLGRAHLEPNGHIFLKKKLQDLCFEENTSSPWFPSGHAAGPGRPCCVLRRPSKTINAGDRTLCSCHLGTGWDWDVYYTIYNYTTYSTFGCIHIYICTYMIHHIYIYDMWLYDYVIYMMCIYIYIYTVYTYWCIYLFIYLFVYVSICMLLLYHT